ncbi:CDGSH iron-sulfur domain-containing protein [bacterium]|jgi:CDGSH iron-sulfur domain-containing protein 3|nr:CDGSH iron-sulfur domain-containing protein [Planctomicrobium sp.]MDB4439626.1 CDGSH iron-sulfur domain-containing protein [Planctomicrobium sp.]MDB4793206.1 CDGSH iron-sulfur domain-containing protein [bacterium]
MSDLPKVAGTSPVKVELEEGKKYAYCTCGLSSNQPFCDGQHKGSGFNPIVFTAEANQTIPMCMCKLTENAPRCDGKHKCLSEPDTTSLQ